MLKTYLFSALFLLSVPPIFAIIEMRDTTQEQQCDTIIDKNGSPSVVKIVSISHNKIAYRYCVDGSKGIHYINTDQIQEIKSKTFALEPPKVVNALESAQKALRTVIWGGIGFFALRRLVDDALDSEGYLVAIILIAFFISPIIAIIGLIRGIKALKKAKKENNSKARGLAVLAIGIPILLIILFLLQLKSWY